MVFYVGIEPTLTDAQADVVLLIAHIAAGAAASTELRRALSGPSAATSVQSTGSPASTAAAATTVAATTTPPLPATADAGMLF